MSPSGDDRAAGTREAPLRTPAAALDRLAEEPAPEGETTLLFHPGVYRIEQPLAVTPAHVPAAGSLTLRATEPGAAVISGGRLLSGARKLNGGVLEIEVPEATGGWTFRELFVNGRRAQRVRFPSTGWLRIDKAFPDRRTGFTWNEGDLPAGLRDGELAFVHDWSISRIPIAEIDHAARTLTTRFAIGSSAPHYAIDHFEPHPRYFIEDPSGVALQPGEWRLEEKLGRLSYRLREGEAADDLEFIAPVAGRLLAVRGEENRPVRNVRLQHLAFEHCAWPLPPEGYAAGQATMHDRRDGTAARNQRVFIPRGVVFELAEDCEVLECRFAHMGTSGIEFGSRTKNCRLRRSHVTDISGNGVMLGEDRLRAVRGNQWWRTAPEQAAAGHVVEDCTIEDCGSQFFGSVGVWIGFARDCRVEHNLIRRLPYTGISCGWNWNPEPTVVGGHRLAFNHIHDVMQQLSDGGGIYTLGRQPGTLIEGNYIHGVPLNSGRAESNGMFLDEGSDQFTIRGNVIHDLPRSPLRFHRAYELRTEGNTLVVREETPPYRYNNTRPETITRVDDRVIPETEFKLESVREIVERAGPR